MDPTGTLYSWLCNNKWETNFRLDLAGFYESRYIIDVSSDFTDPQKALVNLNDNNFGAVVLRK
jgi:hypothetical protein